MGMILKRTGIGLGLLLILAGSYLLGRRQSASPSVTRQHHWSRQASSANSPEKTLDDDKQAKIARIRKLLNFEAQKRTKSSEPPRELSAQEISDIEEADAICAELMDALDEDNTLAILARGRVLIHHPNPEVRQRVLDAFNWVGKDALYDLVDMLDDDNNEIAKAASESFWEYVEDLPNDQAKLKLLEDLSQNQDPDMLSRLAEELSNYHPHQAYNLIQSILSASPETVNEDVQWELEGMTGESFETASEWKAWFIENKPTLEAD